MPSEVKVSPSRVEPGERPMIASSFHAASTRNLDSEFGFGLVAITSNPRARYCPAQLAPMTPAQQLSSIWYIHRLITTDTHFPSNVLVDQDFNHDGKKLRLYEFVSGPVNSGTFGPDSIDPTINAAYLYKETGIFNFGYYQIHRAPDGKVHFIAEVRGTDDSTRPGSRIDLAPQ